MNSPALPVILGTTASGKTSVGILLCKLIGGEVISVDSRKVYKGLPIGTATPKGQWIDDVYVVQDVPHHLMGHLPPDVPYTAGDFAQDAVRLIEQIKSRGKVPVLVGGTGFYFKALQQGLPSLPVRNPSIRQALEKRMEKEGVEILHQELARLDPPAAAAITHRDRHKIIRALEICQLTGARFSDWKELKSPPTPYRFKVMALDFRKELLDRRIEERSRRMLEEGMIEETEAVLKAGYLSTCPALSSFGYKEAVQVVEGKMNRTEFLTALIKGTKAYAKRQRTWLRTQTKPSWFMCDENSKKETIAENMKEFLYSLQ